MNNIILEKIWNDEEIEINGLFQIKITASNKFININEEVYMTDDITETLSKKISNYLKTNKEEYFEVSTKKGTTPGFSMKILPFDIHGHLLIEMNIEIDDNSNKEHYAIFYIETEIGILEEFGKKINTILNLKIGEKISLYETRI